MRSEHVGRREFFTPGRGLFVFSGETAEDVRSRVQEVLGSAQDGAAPLDLVGDELWEHAWPNAPVRAAVVAGSHAELTQKLERLEHWMARGSRDHGAVLHDRSDTVWWANAAPRESPRIGFLFPGQGSQRVYMGQALFERFDWAQSLLDEADRELGRLSGPTLRPQLIQPFEPELDDERLAAFCNVEVSGPAIIVVSVAWLHYLESIGVSPQIVAGHSQGEQTAFYAAGAVDFSGLMALSTFMGRAGSPKYNPGEAGTMVAVSCSRDEAAALIECVQSGYVVIANVNGPKQLILAGACPAIEEATLRARARGLATRPLRVSHAFHSQLVGAGAEYMRDHGPALPAIGTSLRAKLLSCMDGREVQPQTRPMAHFADMVTRPVDFVATVRAMATEVDLLLEVGPGCALSRILDGIDSSVPCLPIEPVPGKWQALSAVAAALWVFGARVDWSTFHAGLSRDAR